MHFLDPKTTLNLIRLVESKTQPPPQILKLKEEIASRTRIEELKSSATGQVDIQKVKEIVDLKLQLDCLYCLWAEGKL